MASCDWQKIHTPQEAKALMRHCITDERLKAGHSNREIDKTRTHLNVAFGMMNDYEMSTRCYDERIAKLDMAKGANRRKDRVTLVGLNVPAPEGLNPAFMQSWFRRVYAELENRFGAENVVGGVVHYDETHNYVDSETGETRKSRPHLHAYVVPVVDEKLNARRVMSRANMIALNNAVEDIAKVYGCRFMTGTHRKSTKSVEELKNASQMVEVQQEAQRILEDAQRRSDVLVLDARRQADEVRKEAEKEREALSEAVKRIRVMHADCVRLRNEYEMRASRAGADNSLAEYCRTIKFKSGKSVLDGYHEKVDENRQKKIELDRRHLESKQQLSTISHQFDYLFDEEKDDDDCDFGF